MNDGGSNGAGCFDIKEWADTTELTNVEVAELGKCSYLVGKRKVFIKDEDEAFLPIMVFLGRFVLNLSANTCTTRHMTLRS